MNRPSFNEAWLAFRKVNHSVADVGSIIGETLGKYNWWLFSKCLPYSNELCFECDRVPNSP